MNPKKCVFGFSSSKLLEFIVSKLLAHEVQLIAKIDPIKYLLEKPVLTERLVRWQSFLIQFEITYVT